MSKWFLDYIDVLLSRIFAPIDLHDPKISPGTGMEEWKDCLQE